MMIRESSKASGLADGERRGGGDVVGESKRTESFLAETLTGAAPHAATDAGAELLRPLLDVEDRLNLQMQGSSDTTIEPTPGDGSSCLSENAGIRSNLSLVKGSGTAGDEAGVTLAPAVGGEDRQASHINADMVPHTHPTNGEFLLEEAIDDGTVVKTAGTILFTLLEALELPETESQGGLLGLTRQDLYLAMRHQTSDGNNQDHKTSVREGVDGMVEWRGETISIKYDGLEETVIAEVWNRNPGTDVLIGQAVMTARHVRSLALLHGHSAPVSLPLSRTRDNGRVETSGFISARVMLVLDTSNSRGSVAHGRMLQSDISTQRHINLESNKFGAEGNVVELSSSGTTNGHLVCSCLTAHDLPQSEGLKFGGKQEPYVMLKLGTTGERSSSLVEGGTFCEWTKDTLRVRVGSTDATQDPWIHDLVVEVWNDNQPRRDDLIGSGLIRSETLNSLRQRPSSRVWSRVKLSRKGRGRKGTLSLALTFELDQSEPAMQEERLARLPGNDLFIDGLTVNNIVADGLGNSAALGFGGLDKNDLYVVARVGVTERITPTAALLAGKAKWEDCYLALPFQPTTSNPGSLLRLEVWTPNAVQDDMVGFAEVDISHLPIAPEENGDRSKFLPHTYTAPLQMGLTDVNRGAGSLRGVSPGVLSCTIEPWPNCDNRDGLTNASIVSTVKHPECAKEPRKNVTLPVIGATEGPGVLKVVVLKATLYEEVEAPEVRLTILPGKRFASTRPLLDIGVDPPKQAEVKANVSCVWNQEVGIPCYAADFEELETTVVLQVEVVVAGVLAGQRVLGQGQADIVDAIRGRQERSIVLDVVSHARGGTPCTKGCVSLSLRYVGSWDEASKTKYIPQEARIEQLNTGCLHSPGILRVFVVDVRELSGLKQHQEPYVVVEKTSADPAIAWQAKPFCSGVATVSDGGFARWIESFDLRIGQAEAEYLLGQPGGGSVRFTVTLMDMDLLGGDEAICSLEAVVTPESLAERDSSVLWHRFFSEGRDRGFVRLACCWIPAELEPVATCGLKPEERVETGILYVWLKDGRNLPTRTRATSNTKAAMGLLQPTGQYHIPNACLVISNSRSARATGQRVQGLPMCEAELRPYAKVGRKKARELLGCARVANSGNADVDEGVFHKFFKIDFVVVNPSDDKDLAETSPTFLATVYVKLNGKKVVSGRAEILLASLCGYKTLNGEAVLRQARPSRRDSGGAIAESDNKTARAHPGLRRAGFTVEEMEAYCPVAAVDIVIPLIGDEANYSMGGGAGVGSRGDGEGGELRLRALYVPDRLADAPGVRSAIKALSRSAEESLKRFTENPGALLEAGIDPDVETGASRVLDAVSTALPGALEVFVMRATNLGEMEGTIDPIVQLRLLCSAGTELHTSELGRDGAAGLEWNRQFSLLVDDANLEMLEVVLLDGNGPARQGGKPLARCKIPLRRYAQAYHSSQRLDIGQVTPESFRLTDHRGRGFRGYLILSLNFLPEVTGQTGILREAFAPTDSLVVPTSVTPLHSTVPAGGQASSVHVRLVGMDGGNVSREDRVRVRVSLAMDSDDWGDHDRFDGSGNYGEINAVISGVGVVDEEAAVCRWGRQGTAKIDNNEESTTAPYGELLSLRWNSNLPLSSWSRGRASMLKFEVLRGPGRQPEWTGFVPTASLAHSPGFVFERAIKLTGRVGTEPPKSARTLASSDAGDGCGVSLEIAMVYQYFVAGGTGGTGSDKVGKEGLKLHGAIGDGKRIKSTPGAGSIDSCLSPFHPDVRRIPCEAGELVVHCLRARNLRLSRDRNIDMRGIHPVLSLTIVPDGVTAVTSVDAGGGRHPVWRQTCTLSVEDAATARLMVRVLDANEVFGDNVIGEVELSVAGIVAAERGMAAAAAAVSTAEHSIRASTAGRENILHGGKIEPGRTAVAARRQRDPIGQDRHVASREPENAEGIGRLSHPGTTRYGVQPCGVEAWFPIFVSSRGGGNRERQAVGEVRLSCRFLSTDFMLQRELTAGADEGDNGPIGMLRYALERQPGRLLVTVRCCRSLPKPMIGERSPLVEATLRPGGWKCGTRRQAGLDPAFNEDMVVELLWTPQDLISPELVFEVKDKALGGGRMAVVRVPVAPFILHPRMPAEIWYPLMSDGSGETNASLFCGLVYVPSDGGVHGERVSETPQSVRKRVGSVVDPEIVVASRRARSGMVHVQVLSARGLPASSKDPQVGVRLRVADHKGGALPPFQRTAPIRGGRGETQFDSTFLLSLRQGESGIEENGEGEHMGRTPVLEVETRCARGGGRPLGIVEIPIFPLWFMGHMTRTWYPMRSTNGDGEAGSLFIGLQFLPDGELGATSAAEHTNTGATERRRFLFAEVRQGRGLRCVDTALRQDHTVHLELLRSGARGKTPPARGGGTEPEWRDGSGVLALPYQYCGTRGARPETVSEVLRITVISEQGGTEAGIGPMTEGTGAAVGRMIGQCDWSLPVEELEKGRPSSAWHALWSGGVPTGDVYLRCRVGYEGEALDLAPPRGSFAASKASSALSTPPSGSYHVKFVQVRGFERTLRMRGIALDASSAGEGLWEGRAFLAAVPGSFGDSDAAYGATAVGVASGQAVAVSTRGAGGSQMLCVQISMTGKSLGNDPNTADRVKAVSPVLQDKLLPLAEVPGSELLEWFPLVEIIARRVGTMQSSGEADNGQVLLSIRYAPLAVGVLEVSIYEAELADLGPSPVVGNIRALTRLSPTQTGPGHKVRRTPMRRGCPIPIGGEHQSQTRVSCDKKCSWADTPPHRLRFNNALNKKPTTLHVSVVHGDGSTRFAAVPVEDIMQDSITKIARDIAQGARRPRGSTHDLGPVGLREEDFGERVKSWYTLRALPKSLEIAEGGEQDSISNRVTSSLASPTDHAGAGRIHVAIRFAPHPKILLQNWQEGASIIRSKGILSMKALFYRLDRSGTLAVEKEDLRLALLEAVNKYIANVTSRAENQVEGKSKAAPRNGDCSATQAGEFVLMMTPFDANQAQDVHQDLAGTAVESMFVIMDRERSTEVTFSEFCAFLCKAAATQAEAVVEDLINELAEDNDDNCDNDSEDDPHIAVDDDGSHKSDVVVRVHGKGNSDMEERATGVKLSGCSPKSAIGNDQSDTAADGRSFHATFKGNGDATPGEDLLSRPQTARGVSPGSVLPCQIGFDRQAGEERRAVKTAPPRQSSQSHPAHQNAGSDGDLERGYAAKVKKAPLPPRKTQLPKNVRSWKVGHVLRWLSEKMQLPQHVRIFQEASIDGLVLCDLTDPLLEGMGMPYLHRLKILCHVQELCKRQKQQDEKAVTISAGYDGRIFHQPRSSTLLDSFDAAGTHSRHHFKRPGVAPGKTSDGKTPHPPEETRSTDKEFRAAPESLQSGEDTAPSFQRDTEQIRQKAESRSPREEDFVVAPEWALGDHEGGFARVMDELHSYFMPVEGPSRDKNVRKTRCKRKIPSNATTSEVHVVVKRAMWEAAVNMENHLSLSNDKSRREETLDEYPVTWWGSSEGESTDESNRIGHSGFEANEGQDSSKGARLLFDEFASFQADASRSPRTRSGSKLTRHRLGIGIRLVLGIDMQWEQSDLFLNSISSLRTHGYLSREEFAREFDLRSPLSQHVTPRTTRSQHGKEQSSPESGGFSPESGGNCEATTMAIRDADGLREYVLGIADTLRTGQQTLGDIISKFDRGGVGKVSVSEFMFLVKALTCVKGNPNSAKITDGSMKKMAYMLLRCVDHDGDRRVECRDLVGFVLAIWTEELTRLENLEESRTNVDGAQRAEVRQKRRLLQKDLRRHFPADFRLALDLDEANLEAVKGPFATLLSRLGLQVDLPTPPSRRSQPTFASPRRAVHDSARSTSDQGFCSDGERLSDSDWDRPSGGRKGRQRHPRTRGRLVLASPPTPSLRGKASFRSGRHQRVRHSYFSDTFRRKASLPPRADLDDLPLSAAENRGLVSQGTFQTYGREWATLEH